MPRDLRLCSKRPHSKRLTAKSAKKRAAKNAKSTGTDSKNPECGGFRTRNSHYETKRHFCDRRNWVFRAPFDLRTAATRSSRARGCSAGVRGEATGGLYACDRKCPGWRIVWQADPVRSDLRPVGGSSASESFQSSGVPRCRFEIGDRGSGRGQGSSGRALRICECGASRAGNESLHRGPFAMRSDHSWKWAECHHSSALVCPRTEASVAVCAVTDVLADGAVTEDQRWCAKAGIGYP